MSVPTALAVAAEGLAVTALLAALTWLASLRRDDVSLVDRMWPVMIAASLKNTAYVATSTNTKVIIGTSAICILQKDLLQCRRHALAATPWERMS